MYRKMICVSMCVAALALVGGFLSGCSSSSKGTPPAYDVAGNLAKGWTSFASGDYDEAVTTFTDVLGHSTNNTEALLGRGWCYAFKRQYTSAIADLESSLSANSSPDVRMGLAAAYRDLPDFQAAISNASEVISADSHYVFSKKASIDFKDAHLIKAQCYFRLGKAFFPFAHVEANYLCDLLGLPKAPDPITLSPAEYEKKLGEKLEDLSTRLGD